MSPCSRIIDAWRIASVAIFVAAVSADAGAEGTLIAGLRPSRPHAGETAKVAGTEAFKGLDGGTHTLQDWKGKVVILNFWATWCSPCLYEINDFVAYQEQYGRRGLQIVSVGLDEERKLRNVQRSFAINYPVLISNLENSAALMKAWGNPLGTIPYSVVMDRNGRVVSTYQGQISREIFDEDVLPLLGGS